MSKQHPIVGRKVVLVKHTPDPMGLGIVDSHRIGTVMTVERVLQKRHGTYLPYPIKCVDANGERDYYCSESIRYTNRKKVKL